MTIKDKVYQNIASSLYRGIEFVALNITAPHKLTLTLDYRRRWSEFLNKKENPKGGLWIHGASVGELEDLAAFYTNKNLVKEAGYSFEEIILTSSSPSAEAYLKKINSQAQYRYAGPLCPDVSARVKDFFQILNPELLVLSQSDTWPVLFSHAQKQLKKGALWLPHKSTSAKWSKKHFLSPLVKQVGLRHENSVNPIPSVPSTFIGSPRIDRIFERIENSLTVEQHPLKKYFSHTSNKIKILVASAWKEDAEVLKTALQGIENKFDVYLIPHETQNSTEVITLQALFGSKVILQDGILLESYRDFDIALVGGAFQSGLHNITEALAWGIPTLCGPDTRKQPDAEYFIQQGALVKVNNALELNSLLNKIISHGNSEWNQKALMAQIELQKQRGASKRLASIIKSFA